MARFIGGVRGKGDEETRTGGIQSGLSVRASGWNFAVSITAEVEAGEDVMRVYVNDGTYGRRQPKLLATVRAGVTTLADGEEVEFS